MYRALFTSAQLIHGYWTGRLLVPHTATEGWKASNLQNLNVRRENNYLQHFLALRALCDVSKEDQCALLDDDDNVVINSSTPHNLRFAYFTVRALSKPNTHRLRELYVQLRDFWPHVIWLSELSLEKGHQRVKRILTGRRACVLLFVAKTENVLSILSTPCVC